MGNKTALFWSNFTLLRDHTKRSCVDLEKYQYVAAKLTSFNGSQKRIKTFQQFEERRLGNNLKETLFGQKMKLVRGQAKEANGKINPLF